MADKGRLIRAVSGPTVDGHVRSMHEREREHLQACGRMMLGCGHWNAAVRGWSGLAGPKPTKGLDVICCCLSPTRWMRSNMPRPEPLGEVRMVQS